MALPDGSYERLRAADRVDEIAYVRALFLAGPAATAGAAAHVLLGGAGTLLSERAKRILSRIGNGDLLNMVIAPWLSLRWPRRRTVLWELCGRAPVRHLAEASWAASADISRRIFERAGGRCWKAYRVSNGLWGKDNRYHLYERLNPCR